MSDERIPAALWEGELRFGPLVLECAVLDDGRRVIKQESMMRFMEWMGASSTTQDDIVAFAEAFGTWSNGGGGQGG